MSSSISSSRRFVVAALAVSLALLLSALGAMEIFLRRQEARTADADAYRRLLAEGTAPWAAFGDSHAANGLVSTAWLDNLGQASDNLESIAAKVRLRAARGGLSGVILSADPQIFAFYRLTADQSDRVAELRQSGASPWLVLRPQNRPYLARLALSLLADPGRLFTDHTDAPAAPARPDPGSADWRREATLRMQLHTPVAGLREQPAAALYRGLVAELRAKGLAVCLVRFPVSRTYRDVTDEAAAFRDAWDFFRQVAATEGAALADLRGALPDAAFGDPDHLLSTAAPAFTETVRRACGAEPVGTP